MDLVPDPLIAAFREEPETGLERILDRFEAPLLRHARALLMDREAARDVVQESFLRFLKERPAVSNLGGWLYRVSRNLALDILRKEKRRMRFHVVPDGRGDPPEPAAPGQERAIEAAVIVEQALARLKPEQREVVTLKVHEGLSYREIAAITGMPPGTVGFVLHEAMKTLAADLVPAQGGGRS
jgi:RNA polymerase sigma-70 factor (ECF subfamily)